VQEEFIRQSRVAIKKASRKRAFAFVVGAIIFIIAVFAFVQIKKAQENEPELTDTKFAELFARTKKAEEEAARKKAEEEAARKKAEEEAARKKAEEEAARKKAEEMVRYKAIAKKNAEQFQALVEAGEAFRDKLDDGSLGPEMVWIPAGTFKMGNIQGGGGKDEKPVHEVSVESFAMGRYEVTVDEFQQFVEATNYKTEAEKGNGCYVLKDGSWEKVKDANWRNPYFPQKDNHQPVVCVSWNDAVEYTKWLNRQTDKQYGLPSEAEWEYAARAGTETKYWWGNDIGDNWANCNNNFCGDKFEYTSPVGSFGANPFGLYDTAGNVWEWVVDGWHDDYKNAPNDGRIWAEGADKNLRVLRGGSWFNNSNYTRTAYRNGGNLGNRYDDIGFRVVRRRVVARTF
jgi:formylglycine-generating enzyme required for sulfatase activity